jgi:hypothetical protein
MSVSNARVCEALMETMLLMDLSSVDSQFSNFVDGAMMFDCCFSFAAHSSMFASCNPVATVVCKGSGFIGVDVDRLRCGAFDCNMVY